MVTRTDADVVLRLEALVRLLEEFPPPVRKALVLNALREHLGDLALPVWDSWTG